MVSSLECASEWLEGSNFIVSYSDIFYSQEAVRLLLNQDAEVPLHMMKIGLSIGPRDFFDPFAMRSLFQITSDSFLSDIGRKDVSLDQINGQFMGMFF